jgi:kynurenine formamidase
MPQSPFAEPVDYTFNPPSGVPYSRHGFHHELTSGSVGGQGTQFDALGHFGYLPEIWKGEGEFPAEDLMYYGGYTHSEVQPGSEGPLQRLGMENVPPIVTSAVLLNAQEYVGNGEPLEDGDIITPEDIEGMLQAQVLGDRGLLPGDVLYIYTGWERHCQDPAGDSIYYTQGPGLAYATVDYLEEHAITLVALDNPFTDPAPEGKLRGQAELTEGMPQDLPFGIHHHNLTQAGIHQIQNARLAEMAEDGVWTSCTMVFPLNVRGAAQSPVRPIAIGAPDQSGM